jgi:hypothetical protein
MQTDMNNILAYTSNTLLNAYKKRQVELTPFLKNEENEEKIKKIQLAILSIDLCVQIFNDANRAFPVINKEILKQENQGFALVKNQTAGLKKLKKSIATLNKSDDIIFEKKVYYSLELSKSNLKEISKEMVSNILKESAFLFTHILHLLYNNENQEEVFNSITAHIKYLLGLCIIEPVSFGIVVYKEILQEREKYEATDEIDTFIFNAHHFCLSTLLFSKHWMGQKEYLLEEAEKDLNDKINAILKQRQNQKLNA